MNFWQEFNRRGPYKIVKILYYLKLCLENIFWLNYLFHSSKEVFLHNFRQFLENWNFDRNSTGADLTNIVKILYYLTLCFENIFWLNYLFHSSKEVFLHNFRQVLGKLKFWPKLDRRGPYKYSENFVLSHILLWKYFLQNYLFHSSKEVFLHNFRQFLENWIFDRNSTGADLTKIVKILYYLKFCALKIFFG